MSQIEDQPLAPDAMLRLAERQRDEVRRASAAQAPWYLGIWGGAWLLGYLTLGIAAVTPSVPAVPASIVFAILLVAAFVASVVMGVRSNRGVYGVSAWTGAVFGLSWPILSIAFGLLGGALIAQGMPDRLAALYYPSAYALMVGALYLAGAALYRSVGQLVLALVMIVVGAAAPFFGAPTNLFVMAFCAGGSLLVAGAVYAIALRRR